MQKEVSQKYNIDFLYELYKEYGGSLNAMENESRRLNLPYLPKQRETIKKLVIKEGFEGKYRQEQAIQKNIYLQSHRVSRVQMVSIAKEGILKYMRGLSSKKYISEHGLKILWEIMKTELGESTVITLQNNVDDYGWLMRLSAPENDNWEKLPENKEEVPVE
jgi:hypothetical protein